MQSTRAAYDRVIELKVATPQMILNYASFLEEHNHFELAFSVCMCVSLCLWTCTCLAVSVAVVVLLCFSLSFVKLSGVLA